MTTMYKVVGDYQLTERIGRGNFADVYLGTNTKTNIKYAVKVISKETFSEPKLIAGLDAEIKIMKEFSHKNIVQLFKYFSSEKNYYLVVEYCAGGDLSKFIKKSGRLTEGLSLNFLVQLTEGLAFLHEKHFIHRDLKPANVLLTEQSENAILKLADFGFARHLSTSTLAQTRCGTPLYMAPEILEARDYDSKADVWSLGCIFYEMLVGVCPFKGANEADLLNTIRTQALKIPGTIEVSKNSISILIKLLERTSTRRASIDQLVTITRKFLVDNESKPSSETGNDIMNTSSMKIPASTDSPAKAENNNPQQQHASPAPMKQSGMAVALQKHQSAMENNANNNNNNNLNASTAAKGGNPRSVNESPVQAPKVNSSPRSLKSNKNNDEELSEKMRRSSLKDLQPQPQYQQQPQQTPQMQTQVKTPTTSSETPKSSATTVEYNNSPLPSEPNSMKATYNNNFRPISGSSGKILPPNNNNSPAANESPIIYQYPSSSSTSVKQRSKSNDQQFPSSQQQQLQQLQQQYSAYQQMMYYQQQQQQQQLPAGQTPPSDTSPFFPGAFDDNHNNNMTPNLHGVPSSAGGPARPKAFSVDGYLPSSSSASSTAQTPISSNPTPRRSINITELMNNNNSNEQKVGSYPFASSFPIPIPPSPLPAAHHGLNPMMMMGPAAPPLPPTPPSSASVSTSFPYYPQPSFQFGTTPPSMHLQQQHQFMQQQYYQHQLQQQQQQQQQFFQTFQSPPYMQPFAQQHQQQSQPAVDADGFVVVDNGSKSNPDLQQQQQQQQRVNSYGMPPVYLNPANIPHVYSSSPQTNANALLEAAMYVGGGAGAAGQSAASRPSSATATAVWDLTKQAFNSNQQPQQQQAEKDAESMQESLMFHAMLQKCETFCDTIKVVTNLADQFVMLEQQRQQQQEKQQQQNQQFAAAANDRASKEEANLEANLFPFAHQQLAGTPNSTATTILDTLGPIDSSSNTTTTKIRKFSDVSDQPTLFAGGMGHLGSQRQPPQQQKSSTSSNNNNQTPTLESLLSGAIPSMPPIQREMTVDVSISSSKTVNESIDHYLRASSLYFHALGILKSLLNSLSSYSLESDNSNLFQPTSVLTSMKNDLSIMFDQLFVRGENCQKMIEQLIKLSSSQVYNHKVMIPRAEVLMLEEAFKCESNAQLQELLGHLQRAMNLYATSKKLVSGITLTYCEEDSRKVRNQLKSFVDNVEMKLHNVQERLKLINSVALMTL